MFKHLLVPLDGSGLAEAALPAAAYMAERFGAKVTVIHIIEHDAPQAVHGDRHLTDAHEAEAYLREVGRRFFPADLILEHHVHTAAMKDVARGIVLHESELTPDLIVMSTHGRGGLRDLLFGRIAQQVVAEGNLPVLLIRSEAASDPAAFACRTVLAPTDAKPSHQYGVDVAFEVTRAARARLELLTAVPTLGTLSGQSATTSRFAPGASRAVLEMAEADLGRHLRDQVARFQNKGIDINARLERGEPAATIVSVAERIDADLIVLGTHGKSGTAAFWTQSVGARVLSQTFRPLLLVPV
jgi:nucleotide-binding universal stress UspA family protein